VAFLRADLRGRGIVPCSALSTTRDGKRLEVAGIVLVRQRPGSAKGVMFITIEDETGIANVIVWPSVFEKQRRLILSAGMFSCRGRLQREGEVIHIVAERLDDLSELLLSVGQREAAFSLKTGRGDEAKHGGSPDPRGSRRPRDIIVPIRDFR
jgi:error-prone DNA polymerase